MGIKDLINDSRTSIDKAVASSVDAGTFSAGMRRLHQYGFWSGRSKPALWEHQRQAIETVVAYLSADPHLPERPNLREAALLKLPTGTRQIRLL
jgi:hypothetical protein